MKFIPYLNTNNPTVETINIYIAVNKTKSEIKKEKETKIGETKIDKLDLYFFKKFDFSPENKELKKDKELQNVKYYIENEIEVLKKMEHKEYDIHKEKLQIITLKGEDLKDILVLEEIKNQLKESNVIKNDMEFQKNHITMLVFKIILSTAAGKEEVIFFGDYKYNALLKKRYPILRALGESVDLSSQDERIFILDFHPIAISFKDNFMILNSKVEDIFNFNNFFTKQLIKEKSSLEKATDILVEDIKSMIHKKILFKGIKSKSIENFNGLPLDKKREKLAQLKKAYKTKNNKDLDVTIEEEKIKISTLTSKEREEIFKLIADKASIKIVGETLTTALD